MLSALVQTAFSSPINRMCREYNVVQQTVIVFLVLHLNYYLVQRIPSIFYETSLATFLILSLHYRSLEGISFIFFVVLPLTRVGKEIIYQADEVL